MSLVAEGLHYLLDIRGTEELYDLASDPLELHDLRNDLGQNLALGRFRSALNKILREAAAIQAAMAGLYKKHFGRVFPRIVEPTAAHSQRKTCSEELVLPSHRGRDQLRPQS